MNYENAKTFLFLLRVLRHLSENANFHALSALTGEQDLNRSVYKQMFYRIDHFPARTRR